MGMNSRTQKIHDSIMNDTTLDADGKAVELVSRLSVNPHYGKGEARYEFMKGFRTHVRNAADLPRYDVPTETPLNDYINDESLITLAPAKVTKSQVKGTPVEKITEISDEDFSALLGR